MATTASKQGSATKKSSNAGKKAALGRWSVKRVSETEVTVKLPKGLVATSDKLTIDDLLSAIATANALEKGRVVVKCCSGNLVIV